MSDHRPVFLDIPKMRFPITAIVSICHRISGVVLFLFLPLLIYLLGASLVSPSGFEHVRGLLHLPPMSIAMWVMLVALSFHFFAGLRHILMDFGFGEHMGQAKLTAFMVFVLTVVAAVLEGVWLWVA